MKLGSTKERSYRMLELTLLDLLIIGAYLIGMLLVGVYFVKRIKNPGDYYVAGRTLGPVVLTATVCATIIGGSAMMGRAGLAFTDGFKCVMTAVPYLIGMFIFSVWPDEFKRSELPMESLPFPNFSLGASENPPSASWQSWSP